MANAEHLEILKKKWHWNPFKQADGTWYNWRKAHPEISPDLRRAFLFKRDLREENFSDVDFRAANLVGATLSRANFRRANLSGAHLNSANLYQADLSGAIFNGTDLTQANLSVTVLDGANFDQAVFGGTIFGDTDLLAAEGLENAIHLFPSILGTDTLERAKGKLPTAFLRGCGLSDLDIERERLRNWQLTALELDRVLHRISDLYVARVSEHYSCFISYSHADKPFARGLYEKLQQNGIRCWLDEKQLLPGDDIYEQVDLGIRLWDKVLLCCSQSSLTSWWVDNEITAAFAKEQQIMKERGKKVLALIPLNLDGYLFKWTNGKANQVLSRFAADFTGCSYGSSEFEAQVQRIIASLRVDESARAIPPESRL